jgi:hypothetical protein
MFTNHIMETLKELKSQLKLLIIVQALTISLLTMTIMRQKISKNIAELSNITSTACHWHFKTLYQATAKYVIFSIDH